jgi:hypothetical protein
MVFNKKKIDIPPLQYGDISPSYEDALNKLVYLLGRVEELRTKVSTALEAIQ